MILMPAWVVEENEEGYFALLGSHPRSDAAKDWLPRESVESCVYSPEITAPRFALLTLREVPEEIRKKNPGMYRKVD